MTWFKPLSTVLLGVAMILPVCADEVEAMSRVAHTTMEFLSMSPSSAFDVSDVGGILDRWGREVNRL